MTNQRAFWRVLAVHTHYQQAGGEDSVFNSETALMRDAGWSVERFEGDNSELDSFPIHRLGPRLFWSSEWAARLRIRIREFKPDVVHFHNTFPLMSPSVLWAVKREGVAVVQTLHNFRLGCLSATLFRDSAVCVECIGKFPISGIKHGCWRGRLPSAAVAAGLTTHHMIGTYRRAVDQYIVLSEAAKPIYEKAGLPRHKLSVKPNCLYPEPRTGNGVGGYALFAGRLSAEKGIAVALEAWKRNSSLPLLKIAGGGPLADEVAAETRNLSNVQVLGSVPHNRMQQLVQDAAFLVVPSLWYEGCPMIIVEALAAGTPVISSDFPSLREHLGPELSKFVFEPGDSIGLDQSISKMSSLAHGLRLASRTQYEQRFSASASLARLGAIYEQAIANSKRTPLGR